jgi:hypothetical protein
MLERRNVPIHRRFFKTLSEGLLAVVVKHAGAQQISEHCVPSSITAVIHGFAVLAISIRIAWTCVNSALYPFA